jgi:hypothetical protein
MTSTRFQKQNSKIEAEVLTQNLPLPSQIDKVAKIRGWFRPSDNSIYYPLVQAYLDGKTGLQDTLRKVTAPLDEAKQRDKMYDRWGDLWYSIIHSAKRISYRDEQTFNKLVSFMAALSKESGFEDFPNLGMYSREAWNDAPGAGAGWTAPEISAWTSYNYLLARLDVDGLFNSLSSYGLWALRGALEQNFVEDDDGEASNPATRVVKLNANVPTAVVWVLVAGKKMYAQEEDADPKSKKKGVRLEELGQGQYMWPYSAKFSKERWTFWRARFDDIVNVEKIADETRRVAKEAIDAMDKIEKNWTSGSEE